MKNILLWKNCNKYKNMENNILQKTYMSMSRTLNVYVNN